MEAFLYVPGLPNLTHIKPFGCPAYVLDSDLKNKKDRQKGRFCMGWNQPWTLF
jgi:hypothetical protein